jgi:hypothetical protein
VATAVSSTSPAELDDVMLAMDVVDTIRHRELIVERELNSEARRDELLERLKRLYAAQGLDVPDHVLAAGVAALEEDRFAYTPTQPGFGTTLARWYVDRGKWGKPLLGILGLAAVVALAWHFMVVRPDAVRIAALPDDLAAAYQEVVDIAAVPDARQRAGALLEQGQAALARGDNGTASDVILELDRLEEKLALRYELRVVSRPGQLSGVWRVPEANPSARTYYLIVEAIGDDGEPLAMPVRNEEDGQVHTVTMWGVRVDEDIFNQTASDKKDDGIIQNYLLAVKERGRLEPEYRIPTTGEAITTW